MIRNGWDSSAEHDISVSHGKLARLCCLLAFLASCFVGTLLCGGITVHRRSIGMHNQPWDKSGQGKISIPLTVTKCLEKRSLWEHTTTLSLAWLVTWHSPINGIVTLTRWDSFIDDSCCQSYKTPCHSYATMHRCTSGLNQQWRRNHRWMLDSAQLSYDSGDAAIYFISNCSSSIWVWSRKNLLLNNHILCQEKVNLLCSWYTCRR